MRHIIFEQNTAYPVAILIKTTSFVKNELVRNYITPLENLGVGQSEVIAFDVEYNESGKAPVKFINEYLTELLPVLKDNDVQYIYVADANYFKVLTKSPKADALYGYVVPCAIKGYEHMKVVLGVNYQALLYNTELESKLLRGLQAIVNDASGSYEQPGSSIIKFEEYPKSLADISVWLQQLHRYEELTFDIEAFSLRFWEAGIGTITFCWNKHEGIAFPVDYVETVLPNGQPGGMSSPDVFTRNVLREFFETYKGTLTGHYTPYDIKVLIYTLWMDTPTDHVGMLKGLNVLCKKFNDTKIIAYLALNSTARNSLSLKDLSQEYSGNYAMTEINDITQIPLDKLLRYNLVDGLSTWFTKDKYWPRMVADKQLDIYKTMMMPSQKVIIYMELCGMPMNGNSITVLTGTLKTKADKLVAAVMQTKEIQDFTLLLQEDAMNIANAKLKVKQHPLSHFSDVTFNPNSNIQLQKLLYEFMQLPVIDLTDSKQPATGGETLKKLINHTPNIKYREIIQNLIDYMSVATINSNFIPAFNRCFVKDDGWHYLHGSFNLGGTVSGRLSSSDPNLQNIPANSIYGKPVKEAFEAPPGWLFAGADFNSLEDYISALTTKDPNKLKVYTDGFDGHCLRASYYFKDMMPDIDPTDVVSVNSIKDLYPEWRQESKTPTFALTYQGTYKTLMNNIGWDFDKAKMVEDMYHELYKVSDQYIQDRLAQASKDGYVEVAFGLRVRTPVIHQVIWGAPKMPFQAIEEGRTAGNAMGQSYGLLNNRAINAFMEIVWKSKFKHDILPVALIHDAIYLMIRNEPAIVEFANKHLIKEMQWQNLPELMHPTVKIGAALDIFYPTWAKSVTLPIGGTQQEIEDACVKHMETLK